MWQLSDDQRALQDLARDFAAQEVRPIAKDLDLLPDPARRFPWGVLERASEAGLRTLALPAPHGGASPDLLTLCLVYDELAYGDLGFASALAQTWRASLLVAEDDEAASRLLPAFVSDNRFLMTVAPRDADAGRLVAARRVASGWDLDGQCSAVASGSVARLFLVDAAETETESHVFAVPAKRPGLRVARLVDTAGRRLCPMADLELALCSVSEADRVGPAGAGAAVMARSARRFIPIEAIGALAVARSAYDLAVDWARKRVQGGKVIIEHSSVAMKLGDMALGLEAARDQALAAAWAVDHDPDSAERRCLAARVMAGQIAGRICYDSMQVWGGMGFMREGGMEKFTRDAASSYTEGQIDASRERLGKLAGGAVPLR
ncbi:MAG: acyl-CoA/acyl-ACP dehydrogenase [Chloroflexi bacterium]|nr:acyl-CoA/acyl-ACP dehydrogenase [Chloroflexota bacterium]